MDKEEKEVSIKVPASLLQEMQAQIAALEIKANESAARADGLEKIISEGDKATGGDTLKMKKDFEPKFNTVRLRKYPIAGDVTNLGIVSGWSNRGAYEEVDRNGVSPVIVNFLDICFLDHEKNAKGVLQFEKVKLTDLFNKGVQETYKVLDRKVTPNIVPTGEEINVTIFDPAHGMISTGDKVDGYTAYSDTKIKVAIPGKPDGIWFGAEFLN